MFGSKARKPLQIVRLGVFARGVHRLGALGQKPQYLGGECRNRSRAAGDGLEREAWKYPPTQLRHRWQIPVFYLGGRRERLVGDGRNLGGVMRPQNNKRALIHSDFGVP